MTNADDQPVGAVPPATPTQSGDTAPEASPYAPPAPTASDPFAVPVAPPTTDAATPGYGAPPAYPGAAAYPAPPYPAQPSGAPAASAPGAFPPPPTYGDAIQAAQPYPYTPAVAGPPRGISVASMICGIAGVVIAVFWMGLLPAVAAVVLGHMGQRKQPYARPFWLTGIITGYVGVAIGLIQAVILVALIVSGFSQMGDTGTFGDVS
ncbi:MAG: hypothetical protein JWM51_2251 [Microbacteriaceae bacterium]|nr:hypothetical protein [Microbacteriaceae bacterium]